MILTFIVTLLLSWIVGYGEKSQSLKIYIFYIILTIFGTFLYSSVKMVLKRKELEAEK